MHHEYHISLYDLMRNPFFLCVHLDESGLPAALLSLTDRRCTGERAVLQKANKLMNKRAMNICDGVKWVGTRWLECEYPGVHLIQRP